jgi:hypothetical protein
MRLNALELCDINNLINNFEDICEATLRQAPL